MLLALAWLPGAARASHPTDPVPEAEWILSLRVTSGPDAGLIPLNEPRDRCIPYLANMAASGLAAATVATGEGRYAAAAWDWLGWYAAHMDAAGFVTDYQRQDGIWVSTGDMDSTDAYAATFLVAVRDAWAATQDATRLAAIWPGVQKAVAALEATADADRLTYAKPGHTLKYLMDNAEVYEGLRALEQIAVAAGDSALEALASEWTATMAPSLESFWNPARGGYDVAISATGQRDQVDWAEFYPSTTAQAWMINTGLVPAERAHALADRIDLDHPAWDTPGALDVFDTPGGPATALVKWWPEFVDAFTAAGLRGRAETGLASMVDAALGSGRAWPYHTGNAGRVIRAMLAWPETTIAGGPPDFAAAASAVFTFGGSATAASFECSLDGGAFEACASPHTLVGLSEASHSFRVRALDAVGHEDPTPAERVWVVDTTAPVVRLTGVPPDPSDATPAAFAFDGDDSTTPDSRMRYECALDGGSFAACAAPVVYASLGTGTHTFRVRALDEAGNPSADAGYQWFADTVAPQTTISSAPPAFPSAATVTIGFDGTDDTTSPPSYECRLGMGSFAACASPVTYDSGAEGGYVFEVRARDATGNVDATPAAVSWFVDRTAPASWISSGPPAHTNRSTARLEFGGADSVARPGWLAFECRLDGATFQRCASPVTTPALSDGTHVFEVRARDAAGNVDATPAAHVWTIDTVAPATTIDTPDGAVVVDIAPFAGRIVAGQARDDGSGVESVTVEFAGISGSPVQVAATLQCDDASGRRCAWTARAPGSGRWRVRAVAADRAGTTDAPGPPRIVVYAV